jgi:hypothetical protein
MLADANGLQFRGAFSTEMFADWLGWLNRSSFEDVRLQRIFRFAHGA